MPLQFTSALHLRQRKGLPFLCLSYKYFPKTSQQNLGPGWHQLGHYLNQERELLQSQSKWPARNKISILLGRQTEKAIAPHSSTLAWKIPWTEEPGRLQSVHGVAKRVTRLSDFTFPFHFRALEKEMATHSSVLAWRIPGTGEPGGLPSMGSHSQTRLKRLSSNSRRKTEGIRWSTFSHCTNHSDDQNTEDIPEMFEERP